MEISRQKDETNDLLIQRHLNAILTFYGSVKTDMESKKPVIPDPYTPKKGEPSEETEKAQTATNAKIADAKEKTIAINKAIEILENKISSTLKTLIAKRLKTVENYETSINVLTQSLTMHPTSTE